MELALEADQSAKESSEQQAHQDIEFGLYVWHFGA
jgi:hypothetical protein